MCINRVSRKTISRSRKTLSGSNCRIIQGATKIAKATINEEKGVFVTAEIIAVTAAAKIPANHTIPKPKR